MTMSVEMCEKTFLLARGPIKIHRQHAAAWLQNPSHFAGALLPRLARKMMQHYRGQYGIELAVGKRQHLRHRLFEDNLDTGLSRLLLRSGQHFRRRIDPADNAGRPNMPLGCDCKASCSAADIEYDLAASKTRRLKKLFSERALATEGQQPDR